MRSTTLTFFVTLSAAAFAGLPEARAQQNVPNYELPPINYSKTTPNNAVSRLQQKIALGEIQLNGTGRELLLKILHELRVPVESQTVVFSQTSLQKDRINPETPRALYFSDSVYVGWVPDGLIEVAALDAELGPVFYSVNASDADAPKTFSRDANCMLCHGYFYIRDIPSLVNITLFPDTNGQILPYSDFDLVNDMTRFEKRWGGWYVTGYSGKETHRGNTFGSGEGKKLVFVPSEKRPDDLSGFFDTSRYPASTSDALNLLIFEHQAEFTNAVTRVSQNVRLKKFASETEIVDALLFRRAAKLPAGIAKDTPFAKVFLTDARRSRAGDSLKDLQVEGQLFRNRCSYLVYSESFAAIPEPMKTKVYTALFNALHDEDPEARYSNLDRAERKRIYDILMETHPEARQYFEKIALHRS